MRTVWKIAGRVLAGLLVTVYVAVALVNYSVVQSYLGTAVGQRLSREWGGTVKIGALHAMPWDHLILNNVLLVSPTDDTLFTAERLGVHFKKFPYRNLHLSLDRVYLRNGYYHLAVSDDLLTGKNVTNLQYIIDYYLKGRPRHKFDGTFTVDVGTLTLDHVRYKMDLPEIKGMDFDVGVSIAHMEFVDIVSRIKDIHVVNDDVTCRLVKLTAEERSGFKADQLEGNVHVGRDDLTVTDFELRTPRSRVAADVRMSYHHWMADYCDSVVHDILLKEGTSVSLGDVAYWAPWLWGTETQVDAKGTLLGTINDMHTDLSLYWGEQSGLWMAGTLQDITCLDTAVVDIDIERLWTNLDDLAPLFALMKVDSQKLTLARQANHIDLGGHLHGGLHTTTTANINLTCGLGNLHADALLTPLASGGMHFNAEAGSNGLGLKMLRSDWLSHTGFALSATGDIGDLKDLTTLYARLEGHLLNSVVRGQRLAPIEVACKLDGGTGSLNLESTDSLALLTLRGDFALADTMKSVRCTLDVERLNTLALKLLPEKYGMLTTFAEIQYEGKDLETMQGGVALHGTRLGEVLVDRLSLSADARDGYKEVRLKSDPVDLSVDGRFDYGDLPLIARQLGSEMLPADLFDVAPLTEEERGELEAVSMNLHLLWKDDGRFLQAVDDKLAMARNTRLSGSYNSAERLKVVMRSDSLRYGAAVFTDVGIDGRKESSDYVVRLLSQEVNIGRVELLQRADLQLTGNARRTLLELAWGYNEAPSEGDVELRLDGSRVEVLKPDFRIGDTPWELLIDTLTLAYDGRLQTVGSGIMARSQRQSVDARLSLLGQSNDVLELTFDHFGLGGLTDIVLQESPVTLNGDINGRFSLYGLNDIPYLNANLRIDSCVVNRQPLGEVKLRSNWNAELNILNLQLDGDQLDADGWIVLGDSDGEMNFSADFDHLELALAAPLLRDFSSRFEGLLHGTFDITGTLSRPIIVGEALVEDGALQVDMTGVTYYFNDSVQFNNNRVVLDGFRLRDPRGDTAYVDGTIHYDELNDVRLDLSVHTDNLLVLDRRQGDDFYGTVLASAQGTVQGPVEALNVNVNARTMPGCTLTVPVNDQRQVKAQDYIHFVSDRPETEARRQAAARKERKMSLEVDLSITPDMQLNLPMDFSEIGVKVGANGSGDLHLTMSGSESPQVLGNYEITSGTMKFSALSLISKDFTLESGSNLNFQGSLPEARFDLQAVYSQRVNLSTLTGGQGDAGTQKYIQVEDVIAIAGTLQEPTINFDIRLPNADASVEEEVFAYIDRNSERDMLNQTLSLLALGHFYNANSTSANGNIATSGSISALNSILSDMTGIDIGVDYKMGNELTKDQLDVNISKDWGRFYLESTLGYGGESRELQTGDANSAIIDALVGYRLSPLVHLYAYNRTNTNDYTRMDLPYKQGVGLKLTKDFDRWGDLLKKKKK